MSVSEVWKDRDTIILRSFAKQQLDQWGYTAADIMSFFQVFDSDGSGELDAEEFREALAQFGFEDKDEQDAMFREIDADGGGTVSWDEFLRWWRGEDDWEPEDEQEGEGEH